MFTPIAPADLPEERAALVRWLGTGAPRLWELLLEIGSSTMFWIPPRLRDSAPARIVAELEAAHPALSAFADPAVTPIWDQQPPLGHVAELLAQARRDKLLTSSPRLETWEVGDLYQRLSAEARKLRALVQTPPFVAELLVPLSYEWAFREWGVETRIMDPACGTGHLLLEAYDQVVAKFVTRRDGMRHDEAIVRALGAIHGVEIDAYAAAIAICSWRMQPRPRAGIPVHPGAR